MKETENNVKIEEMANDIAMICPDLVENGCGDMSCVACLAKGLEREGYERRSEWISVDERLPEKSGDYLTYHEHRSCGVLYYNADIKLWNVYYSDDVRNAIRSITHWMPLPEAPKMKGGVQE